MSNLDKSRSVGTCVGVVSDTHGLLRPEAVHALVGADLILHAGDIGEPSVLEELKTIARVIAVRGNNDTGIWAEAIPERETIKIEAISVHLLHIRKELKLKPTVTDFRVVVTGHSHKPLVEEIDGVLFVNPGSAGPRRFKLPVSIARLYIEGTAVDAQIIELAV